MKKYSANTFCTGLENTEWSYSTAGTSADDQKKLKNYWERFENYVKPRSNELIAAWELHNLPQGTLSLEEFIAKLIILVKEAKYPAEHHDRFLNTAVEVHSVTSENRNPNQRDQSDTTGGTKRTQNGNRWEKIPTCRNCGWGPHAREQCPAKNATCHYCQKIGHLAKVCLSKLRKKNTHKIDSGAETNVLLKSLYQQLNPGRMGLAQPTMRLSAYGGVEIPNLGSYQIYVKGPNNPSPKPIQAEVVDVHSQAIIGNMSAQNLNLLKLNWPITANQYSDDLISHRGAPTPQVNHTKPTHDLHTVRPFDMRGKRHPFPLTNDYLLKEYEDVFTRIGCFPGAPYHIETDPEVSPIQHAPR